MYTFIKELPQYVSESLSGRFRELKSKGKDQLVIPKSGRGRLSGERSLTRVFESGLFPGHGIMAHTPWPLSQSNPWNCTIQ